MFFFCRQVDKDIVKENLYELIQNIVEYAIHQTRNCGSGICQAKRNYYEFIIPITGPKCCFVNIFLNPDLVITRSQIQIGEDSFSLHLVEHIINLRERIHVLDVHFI